MSSATPDPQPDPQRGSPPSLPPSSQDNNFTAPKPRISTRQELWVVGQHAQVLVVGQLATMAYGVTDTIVAGRYSDQALATLAVASSVFISIYVSLMSVTQALMPIYAELHGARQPRELGRAFRQSAYLGLALMLLGMAVLLNSGWLLALFDVPENLRPGAAQYLGILGWTLIPTLGFRMFSSLNQSMELPRIVMWLQITSLLVKIPLTVWFVFGAAGIPEMGVAGCALASFTVNCMLFIAAMCVMRWRRHYQSLDLFRPLEKPDWPLLKNYAALGIPAGLASLVEVTSYTLMGLLVARLGVVSTAGHQIAASVAAVLFMLPLSLSIASCSRVSYWMGAGDVDLANRLARAALGLAIAVAVVASGLMVILAEPISQAYSKSPLVSALGSSLLLFVGLYHVADAWQTMGCFLLRCWRITVMPFLVYAVALWGLGLGGGFVLAYRGVFGIQSWKSPAAFWLMGAIALMFSALAFSWRLMRLTKQVDSVAA